MTTTEIVITVIVAVFGSTGFWSFIQSIRDKKKEASGDRADEREMLLGIGYDRLMHLCHKYIDRGYITVDELRDLNKYLYQPYRKLGGNGTAELLFNKVTNLPNEKEDEDEIIKQSV